MHIYLLSKDNSRAVPNFPSFTIYSLKLNKEPIRVMQWVGVLRIQKGLIFLFHYIL